MIKKRINDKISSRNQKKIYNTPRLNIHGNISEITLAKTMEGEDGIYTGCLEPS
ncbi:MAG: hypothetical protein ABFC34_07995 [Methanobacterium sp.]